MSIIGERSSADMETLREPTPPHDRGDVANMVAQKEAAAFMVDRERLKLVQARVALDRINDGSYGTCLACGEAVSEARLKAVPWAPLCTGCQESVDREDLPGFEHFAAPRPTVRRFNFVQ